MVSSNIRSLMDDLWSPICGQVNQLFPNPIVSGRFTATRRNDSDHLLLWYVYGFIFGVQFPIWWVLHVEANQYGSFWSFTWKLLRKQFPSSMERLRTTAVQKPRAFPDHDQILGNSAQAAAGAATTATWGLRHIRNHSLSYILDDHRWPSLTIINPWSFFEPGRILYAVSQQPPLGQSMTWPTSSDPSDSRAQSAARQGSCRFKPKRSFRRFRPSEPTRLLKDQEVLAAPRKDFIRRKFQKF